MDSLQLQTYWDPERRQFLVPLGNLADLRLGDIPAHSTLEILDLPAVRAPYEVSLSVTNGGEDGEDEYLSASAHVGFSSPHQRDDRMIAVRRAYLPLVEAGVLPEPFSFPIKFGDHFGQGVLFTLEGRGRRLELVSDAIVPALRLFGRLREPLAHVFLCHASEDKPVARRLAAYLEQHGAHVWLDEMRIKVGDSIVQRIDEGVASATHVAVLLSVHASRKAWVKREFSAALMRQLADASVRVLPVRLDDSPVPALISDLRYADCRSDDSDGFRHVLEAILPASSSSQWTIGTVPSPAG